METDSPALRRRSPGGLKATTPVGPTFEEALLWLEALRPSLQWALDDPCWSVRARLPGDDRLHCPLTALACKRVGKAFLLHEWEAAGEALGLPNETARRIMQASDNWARPSSDRARLLAAVGLIEPAEAAGLAAV